MNEDDVVDNNNNNRAPMAAAAAAAAAPPTSPPHRRTYDKHMHMSKNGDCFCAQTKGILMDAEPMWNALGGRACHGKRFAHLHPIRWANCITRARPEPDPDWGKLDGSLEATQHHPTEAEIIPSPVL